MGMDKLKLTSSEIGTLWGEYVNGTMTDVVNRYMFSIIEDESIKATFEDAIKTFAKQKKQIVAFIENEGFPVPIGFTESDLNKGTEKLFTDIFCLNYLHIMTLYGLLGHTTSLGVSVREDLRHFYDSCDNDAKRMYHQTIELLLEKGNFQRDPYFYPTENPEFISSQDFTDGFFGKGRRLSAPEIISISFNLKKSIMAKTLSIGFSQVTQSKEVRKFLEDSEKTADGQIQAFSKIMHTDNLPVPMSWETEVTTSRDSPFSDKLMMYHIGFLFQAAQVYHGTGLASAMRTDLVTTYEGIILKNLIVTKKWFDIMVKNKWLEQPPLAPNRKEIAKEK
ncbi:DUF3231 family protein [Priestia megaterium]|jgi:hypothetical protein|uniref:DUF3231 family protein n=12 Tax=Priestia TaxID=2800373 RepID=D5DNY9_PRIM1|nr:MULTISPECIES: DUF3231 family protein [Priestia]AVX07910.1 DUF3231 domain-containing protein [Bacillus sp. Y-01]KOP74060.1 hypothetical protein AMS61_06855 [Bacillus sp. FJAT-21351]KQU20740.1 hypothetical protein ASG61_26055 [Bacillus sp. Leaf75]MBZ5482703.1 DUF3231 family protein [Bacillus sp. T_4]MDH6655213.1 hypothetical protein [Bacillus sp. PvP124]MDP9574664.1 hypothetical protein [Bacillus sp. 1751]RFB30188.1 DUF3231 family protein [Bacillus sp. ALD]RFB40416.1 DUF3231 family protein